MKRISFILAFFLMALCCMPMQAQQIQVSEPEKLSSRIQRFRVLGQNKTGIVVHKSGREEEILSLYDFNLNLQFSKPLNFRKQDVAVEKVMLRREGATVFYLAQEKSESILYGQFLNGQYDLQGNAFPIDTLSGGKDLIKANFRHRIAQNQSIALFYMPEFKSAELTGIWFMAVTSDLKLLYRSHIQFDDEDLTFSAARVANNGDVVFVLNKGEENNSAYELYHYGLGSGSVNRFEYKVQYDVFDEIDWVFDNLNGSFTGFGLYSDPEIKGKKAANGIFLSQWQLQEGNLIPSTEKYHLFEDELMLELTGKDKEKGENKLYTFEVRNHVNRTDGGLVVMIESTYDEMDEIEVPRTSSQSYSSYRFSQIYYYNDVIAYSFDAEGEIDWQSIVRKRQISENDNGAYSSFTLYNEREGLRLVYLEEVFSKAGVVQALIDPEGNVDQKISFNQEDYDVMLVPKLGKQVSPSEVVIPSYKRSAFRLLRIRLQ